MTIEEKMKQVLARAEHVGPDNPDFHRLREFYEEKKKEGVVKKQEYTIPPIDTVGRIFYSKCQDGKDKR
ncbi:MAG TPA: hypothetical protein VGS78_02740 [Candidatus Sulfotelmatobacter sp.]|nr:hypothetical protein [Candidatus Sulfotelmatobacter sp.]